MQSFHSELIETDFARNDAMTVEARGDLVIISFFGQNGTDYVTHTMTSNAALKLTAALTSALAATLANALAAEGVEVSS